jgi:hypothetical protein
MMAARLTSASCVVAIGWAGAGVGLAATGTGVGAARGGGVEVETERNAVRLLPQPKEGLPPEVVISLNKEFQDALKPWNSSIEPLEDLMAPYLNYHYASAPSVLVGRVQLWWRRVLSRTSWGDRRGGSG